MRTNLCERFGIDVPIFAFSHCRDVVAAVSRSGGLGVLGVSALSAEQLDRKLHWLDRELGDIPYGVDIVVPAGFAINSADEPDPSDDAHRRFVADLVASFEVPELDDAHGALRDEEAAPFAGISEADAAPLIEVMMAHPVKLVAHALGPPPAVLVEACRERGIPVAGLVGTVRHAERQLAAGVDIVVAQGSEGGGHTGEVSTMVLTPEVVDAIAPVPVLAAGGIARGRQVAAALALGAQGVWTGSVWLMTHESETSAVIREKFRRATSSDAVRSRCLTGKPARQLRSAWTEAWESPDSPETLPMPLHGELIAEAQARIHTHANAGHGGATELVNYFVGQVVGSLTKEQPVNAVVLDMVDEYLQVIDELSAGLEPAASEPRVKHR